MILMSISIFPSIIYNENNNGCNPLELRPMEDAFWGGLFWGGGKDMV